MIGDLSIDSELFHLSISQFCLQPQSVLTNLLQICFQSSQSDSALLKSQFEIGFRGALRLDLPIQITPFKRQQLNTQIMQLCFLPGISTSLFSLVLELSQSLVNFMAHVLKTLKILHNPVHFEVRFVSLLAKPGHT